MAGAVINISGILAAWAVGMTLVAAQPAGAQASETPPSQLNRTDLAAEALRQADALIEKYVQPVAEQEPTPEQKRDIESAMKLLTPQEATKGQGAIKQFVKIGPPALGELRRLVSAASAENSTGENPAADAYPATMAAIIIRRIETAQRQPILLELLAHAEEAHAVLTSKLKENQVAAAAAAARVKAAKAALTKATAGATPDSPAAAEERKALAAAQAAAKQLQDRNHMLMELNRLIPLKPPPPPPVPPVQPPNRPIPPANVLGVPPISPPTSPTPPSPAPPPPTNVPPPYTPPPPPIIGAPY
jgi:hypothetical protein